VRDLVLIEECTGHSKSRRGKARVARLVASAGASGGRLRDFNGDPKPVTKEDACARIHQPPETVIYASFFWSLEVASPDISNIATSDFADLVRGWGTREGTESVTTNESQDSIGRPLGLAFILHLPGLDELGSRRKDVTIRDVVIIHKRSDERWGKRERTSREVRDH
jgi:hypothetical protein